MASFLIGNTRLFSALDRLKITKSLIGITSMVSGKRKIENLINFGRNNVSFINNHLQRKLLLSSGNNLNYAVTNPFGVTAVTLTGCLCLMQSLRKVLSGQLEEKSSENLWLSSTMKKRRMKMNKHKLKKRRKKLRYNTKSSRGRLT
jgi:hypothetical protein